MPEIRAGLIGNGIGPSLTPELHMAEGRALGLNYQYCRFDTAESCTLASAFTLAVEAGYAGLNVTHPHKQSVTAHLDRLAGVAEQIGTVNTVVFSDREAVGWNTDYSGFKRALASRIGNVEGQFVLVLGAGGAGLAVTLALLDSGVARIAVTDLCQDRVQGLIDAAMSARPKARLEAIEPRQIPNGVSGIVNCTPMGMATHPGMAADPATFGPECWAADIVYFPQETAFVQAARATGMRVMDGTGMALWQAVEAFRLITGHEPYAQRMQNTLSQLLAQTQEIAAK